MEKIILVRYEEIFLKGLNKKNFEQVNDQYQKKTQETWRCQGYQFSERIISNPKIRHSIWMKL